MKTQTKKWKEFKDWRESEIKKVKSSKKYKDLQKQINDIFDNILEKNCIKKIKHHFLFWEYEEIDLISSMYDQAITNIDFLELDILRARQELLFNYIPEETYENFLNWLNKEYKEIL
jgi:hypothetical protein